MVADGGYSPFARDAAQRHPMRSRAVVRKLARTPGLIDCPRLADPVDDAQDHRRIALVNNVQGEDPHVQPDNAKIAASIGVDHMGIPSAQTGSGHVDRL